jgi:DNA-binding IclR family transcriptional regulator
LELKDIMGSLDTSVTILRCFSLEQPELSFAEVVSLSGLPKSSVSRMLHALKDAGLLDQNPSTRRFRPGLLAFELGRLYEVQNDLIDRAETHLRQVCRVTGHTGYVAVLDGAEQVVVRMVPGSNPLQVVSHVGQRSRAILTSNGRALLARFPDDVLKRKLAKSFLGPVPVNAPQSLEDLLQRLRVIRTSGHSESFNESIEGVGSQGIAVVDAKTGQAVGLAISYPSHSTTALEREQVRDELNTVGVSLGRICGDPLWLSLSASQRGVA